MTDAAAIAALLASPSTTARWSCPVAPIRNPSLRQMQPSHATLERASRRAARLVTCSPRASIPGAHRDTIATLAAFRRGLLFGVVERAQRADLARADALEVEQDRGGDQGAGEAAPTGLVRSGDETHAERAVELEEPAGGAGCGLAPRRGRGSVGTTRGS